MYDEQRYHKPDVIKNVVMYIDGSNGVRYHLCFNDCGDTIVAALFDDINIFMATLEYVVANGILHAMTNGKIVDHRIDHEVWCRFRGYSGVYEEPAKDKYIAWLES